MKRQKVLVITNGMLDSAFAKTCHGLLRGSARFEVVGVIDPNFAGQDAGEVMDGKMLGIAVRESLEAFQTLDELGVEALVVGVALPGGILPDSFKASIRAAIRNKLSVVSGLHTFISDDLEFAALAEQHQVNLIDVRKPKPRSALKFWSGEILEVQTPKIAVLGVDCAVGKRTTCRFLLEAFLAKGIKTEMIYTGQTGWMQGYKHGFIFDSTVNDFISGEIERAIVACDQEEQPELILIEGQSALQNPTGPCGSEFLLSGNVKGVILQHVPGRKHYEDTQLPIQPIEKEIQLIELYGAKVLGIGLNGEGLPPKALIEEQLRLEQDLSIPIVRPLEDGVEALAIAIHQFIKTTTN